MTTPTEVVTLLIYDVADALDGKKNGPTKAEFSKVLNTFDRLDTPNPAGKTNINYIRGNGQISGDALKDYALYNVYGEMVDSSPNFWAAYDHLSKPAHGATAKATNIYEEIKDGVFVSERDIWAEAAKLGVK